jgi:hypothetical protein
VLDADVFMMRVVDGTGEVIDSYSDRLAAPVPDSAGVSSVTLLSASEQGGVSTISFR